MDVINARARRVQTKPRCRHFIPVCVTHTIMPSAVTPPGALPKIKASWTCGREKQEEILPATSDHMSGIKVEWSSRGIFSSVCDTPDRFTHTDGRALGKSKPAGRRNLLLLSTPSARFTVGTLCQHIGLVPITARPRQHLIQRR